MASSRPQADVLPTKRGEIGFRESRSQERLRSVGPIGPRPHPAGVGNSDGAATTEAATMPPASSSLKAKKCSFSSWLSLQKMPKVGGITLRTILQFFLQLVFFAGTIAAWVIVVMHLDNSPPPSQIPGTSGPQDDSGGMGIFQGTGSIFLHIAFGIMTLAQLAFIERSIFHMRAQRYCHVHPGQDLPSHRQRSGRGLALGFAPWNRPSLPTYAAALAQSGHGTGDVEDNAIAIPPPPAYGNTRGSTLLLAGFLRNSLRRAPSANGAQEQQRRTDQLESRPVSYISEDGEREHRLNAERALRLADSLARLHENSIPSQTSQPIGVAR